MSRRVHSSKKASRPPPPPLPSPRSGQTRRDRSKANNDVDDVKDHSAEDVIEERLGNRSRSAKGAVEEDEDETESIIVEDEPDGALLEKMRRNMRSHDEGDHSLRNVNIFTFVLTERVENFTLLPLLIYTLVTVKRVDRD